MILGSIGPGVDMEIAVAGNTEAVPAKLKAMRAPRLKDGIEDILIALGKHRHIIRPSVHQEGVFLYVVLDRQRSNLVAAVARRWKRTRKWLSNSLRRCVSAFISLFINRTLVRFFYGYALTPASSPC